jgi:hypothetical protein
LSQARRYAVLEHDKPDQTPGMNRGMRWSGVTVFFGGVCSLDEVNYSNLNSVDS